MWLFKQMSPRERSVFLRVLVLLIVFIPYFQQVLHLFQSDRPFARALCILFMIYSVVFGITNAIAQGINRLIFGREAADERDAAIDAMALRVAYFTLITVLLLAITTMAFLGAITPPTLSGTILLPTYSLASQFVFFAVFLSEATRHLAQLYLYGRAKRA
jgi:hypothetical protein